MSRDNLTAACSPSTAMLLDIGLLTRMYRSFASVRIGQEGSSDFDYLYDLYSKDFPLFDLRDIVLDDEVEKLLGDFLEFSQESQLPYSQQFIDFLRRTILRSRGYQVIDTRLHGNGFTSENAYKYSGHNKLDIDYTPDHASVYVD